MSIKELKAEFENVKNKMIDTGKMAFEQEAGKIFAEHPELESFGWNQYTPYFNDGDTCTFSADEVNIINGNREYGDDDWWAENVSSGWGKDVKRGPLFKAWEKASDLVASCPLFLLEMTFGDHVTVTVTRNGIDTEDYDHD